MSEKKKNRNFAVLGLGRFGTSVVKTLAESNVDILACDCGADPWESLQSIA